VSDTDRAAARGEGEIGRLRDRAERAEALIREIEGAVMLGPAFNDRGACQAYTNRPLFDRVRSLLAELDAREKASKESASE
jgi:hypothetical protein